MVVARALASPSSSRSTARVALLSAISRSSSSALPRFASVRSRSSRAIRPASSLSSLLLAVTEAMAREACVAVSVALRRYRS